MSVWRRTQLTLSEQNTFAKKLSKTLAERLWLLVVGRVRQDVVDSTRIQGP